MRRVAAGIALGIFVQSQSAGAADVASAILKAKTVPPLHDWSGLYFGAHAGFSRGHSDASMGTLTRSPNSGGLIGGAQVGYNIQLPSRLTFGLEADMTFPNYQESNSVIATLGLPTATATELIDYVGTVRARVGYAQGRWLPYVTGGLAYAGERFLNQLPSGDSEKQLHLRLGWAAGAGVEYAIAPDWSVRLEYLYSRFNDASIAFEHAPRYQSTLDFQSLRVGLNRHIDWTPESPLKFQKSPWDTESDRWEIHGQSTYLGQGYPAFRAPYSGANSLTPQAQYQATWSTSLYLNARLWDGGEVYYNPELLQGFGLDNTVGLGGFSSGEAQKSNFPYPHYNTSRLYVRQTFGLGGEQEKLESGPTQLSGKVDISRIVLQVGKFAITDVFDGNAYAKDTRTDFMNWAMWAPGAFDYAADRLGLTYGATAEFNQKNWAVRAGYFTIGDVANSNNFDTRVFQRGSYVLELETRYSLWSQPGKMRAIAWLNSANSGSYRDTLNNPALNLDIAGTREQRFKYGYVLNFEQAVTDDIGLFGRWSWNDGKSEIMAFTDIDSSLSLGASIKGIRWNRPDDVIGIGGAINGLSKDHRDYIAAGGLGVLIGDGALNYRNERIFESYYAFALNKSLTFTADYQFIVNPAYNADCGPVSIFSGRLRGAF